MKLLFVLAVVALASARRHHLARIVPRSHLLNEEIMERFKDGIQIPRFKPSSEFQFLYDAQVMTGIPQTSKQHSGTRIQCLCRIQILPNNRVRMQLSDIQFAEVFNRMVPNPRSMVPLELCDQVPIREELRSVLELPVEFPYEEGLVSSIRFSSEDQPWSTNIKRGVLSLFSARLNTRSVPRKAEVREMGVNEKLRPVRENFDSFTVEEETIEGLCNTTYTMVSAPCRYCQREVPVLNVTKSINFENCRNRPEIKYNFRFAEPCPSCGEKKYEDREKFLESSTIYRYNITGTISDGFVIDSACVEGQYVFTPYNEESNVIVTYTNQTLVLLGSRELPSEKIPTPSSPLTDGLSTSLIYNLNWDIEKEEFYREEDEEEFLKMNPYAVNDDRKELVLSVLRVLVRQMHNRGRSHIRSEAPRQLVRLVKVLRLVKRQVLEDVFESVLEMKESHQRIARDMLVDALGLCGTKPCLSCLLNLITEEKINIIRGSLAIKGLVQSRTVSQPMIDALKEFCSSEVCRESGVCYQSCLLTTGSLIGAMCQRSQDSLATEFKEKFLNYRMTELTRQRRMKPLCDRSVRVEYANWLMRLFEQKKSTYQRILVLKTIANAGLPECIRPLEKIIVNKDTINKRVIRTQAIEALRLLNRRAPVTIRHLLLPIYLNTREHPEVRMMALHQILQTLPKRAILDQIARCLVNEPSRHVAGFTLTYLRSLANSTNPCENRMADDLKLSLRHANVVPSVLLPMLSQYNHYDLYSRKYHAGVGLDFGVMKSNMSYTPHDTAISVHGSIWGFWRKYLITLGIIQHDVDRVLWSMMGIDREVLVDKIQDLRTVLRRKPGTVKPAKALQKIFKTLDIAERSDWEDPEELDPVSVLYLRLVGQDYFMLPLSRETIVEAYKSLPDTITKELLKLAKSGMFPKGLKELRRLLLGGYEFNYNTGAMVRELTRKIPTPVGMPIVFSLKIPTILSIRNGQIKPSLEDGKLSVELRGQPSIASSLILNMEVWSPIVNTGVRAIAQLLAHMPVDVSVDIDMNGQVPVKTVINLPNNKYRRVLVSLRSAPSTFTRVWPTEQISSQSSRWIEGVHRTILGEEWNRRQSINYVIGREVLGVGLRIRGQYHRTPEISLPGTPWCLLSGPNHLVVSVVQGKEPPESVEFRLTSNLFQALRSKLSGTKILKEILEEQDNEFFTPVEFETEDSEEIESIEEIKTQKWKRIGSKHLLKLDIIARGSRKRQVSCQLDCRCLPRSGKVGGQTCMTSMVLSRSPVEEYDGTDKNVNLIVKALVKYPEIPYIFEELTSEKRMKVALIAKYGPKGNEVTLAKIRIVGERSLEQHNLLENSLYYRNYRQESVRKNFRSVFSPISQYERLIKASTLTQFKVSAECNVPEVIEACPLCLNATIKAYRVMKYLAYWNSDVNQLVNERPSGKVKALIRLDPRSFQLVNITVQTPTENTNITDIPLPYPVFPVNLREPRITSWLSNRVTNVLMPTCIVSSRRVRTFDQVLYNMPLQCGGYSVLAKDCSSREQPRFVVMMRRLTKTGLEKEVKIINEEGEEIILRRKECENCINNIELLVNGAVIHSKDSVLYESPSCRIVRDLRHIIRVILLNAYVTVHFDGYTCKTEMSPYYSGLQCGLCGHYDGEMTNEFRTARGIVTESRAKFFRSYLLPHEESECELESEEKLMEVSRYHPRRYEWEDEEDVMQMIRDDSSSIDDEIVRPRILEEPLEETHMIEVQREGHHLYCFSTELRRYCPEGMIMKKHKKLSTTYKCIHRDSDRAHELLNMARRRSKINIDLLEDSEEENDLEEELLKPVITKKQLFPVTCEALY